MKEQKINYPLTKRLYKHYKGGIYKVLFMAKGSKEDEPTVVYKSVTWGSRHTRPLEEWNEEIKIPKKKSAKVKPNLKTGDMEFSNGFKMVKRFKLIKKKK